MGQLLLVFGSLLIGTVCLIAFVFVEANVAVPMLPLRLFKSRSFSGANLLTLFLYAAIGIFFFLFPLDLIQVQGYSTTATGAAMLPLILLMFFLSRWSGGLVARYGARGPLIVGPIIVALGFVLFAMPSIGDSYWRAFFPAIIVLGFGMAVTVAPLTTVVMNSVSQERVGTASGINNAVARVAGVLAIAVLGIVMVKAFGSRLNNGLIHLSLPPAASEASSRRRDQTGRLANSRRSRTQRESGCEQGDRGSFCIWISSCHIDLRRIISRKYRRGLVDDSESPIEGSFRE